MTVRRRQAGLAKTAGRQWVRRDGGGLGGGRFSRQRVGRRQIRRRQAGRRYVYGEISQSTLPQVSPFGSRTLLHGGCIAAAGFRANRVLRLRSWSLCRRWRGASHRALPPSSWPLLVACCTPLLGGSCRCNGCQRCLAHTRWIRRRSQRPNAKPNPKPNPKPHPKPDKPNRKPEPNTEPSTLTLTP